MHFFAYTDGAILGAALIIAIGAQNLFVLRQGIHRDQVFIVCLLSALIDATLILAGALGLGSAIAAFPWLVSWASWGGAVFLIAFGLLSCRRVIWPDPVPAENGAPVASSRRKAVSLTLAFGFLNPHVYLDTVILLGGIASGYALDDRIYFVLGAITASFGWFFTIGYGARFLAPLLRDKTGARILDLLVAGMMFFVAASLIYDRMAATN
ncbi:LysE family transporter [Sneathiella chungangensis]|uniref:LysE family transporter n=1 Tax=Sneathiella chungangensis TaxID=1418234 RepID=A0A845MJ22_9PROT|nr:LysE/ArgO family amino acid transporter [Sneathiella chungangensis]MZR23829.1 LysE family transporter [Sneathiella chungangensis]